MRNYSNLPGQHGLEATPAAFIDQQMQVFDQVRRVLRDDGTFCVNIGDTFSSSGGVGHYGAGETGVVGNTQTGECRRARDVSGVLAKSLCCIPERFCLAMIDRGWILRNKVVWHKRNSMPSSAGDRMKCTWEPVFVFAKRGKYYSDVEGVRTAHCRNWTEEGWAKIPGKHGTRPHSAMNLHGGDKSWGECTSSSGANPGDYLDGSGWPEDVLELTAQPSRVKHYAMFPVRLPLWFMRWLLPRKICGKCGKAWRRETAISQKSVGSGTCVGRGRFAPDDVSGYTGKPTTRRVAETLCWSSACTCQAQPIGATVCDPYSGPGTVAAAAEWLWTHPAEGFDTVLAGAHTIRKTAISEKSVNRANGGVPRTHTGGHVDRVGTPTSVFQPWLPGRAIMIDLDPAVEAFHQQRRDESFASLDPAISGLKPRKRAPTLFSEERC